VALFELSGGPFWRILLQAKLGREKIRYILVLVLFFTCLPAASAADDPVTKRNNDAGLRKTQHVQLPPVAPLRVVKPIPGDLGRRGN
jgi:hypothetical protein